jgi:hypothetical protein
MFDGDVEINLENLVLRVIAQQHIRYVSWLERKQVKREKVIGSFTM